MRDWVVQGLGIDTRHEPDFVVDRPRGLGAYLVMCFSTPFIARTFNGLREGVSGDCLIHDPGFPHWHRSPPGQKEGFRNDWIHIAGRDMPKLLRRYGLPVNRIFPALDHAVLTPSLRRIQRELHTQDRFSREAIALRIEELLLMLARNFTLAGDGGVSSKAERYWKALFLDLRQELHDNPAKPWTLAAMARRVHLSPSRFRTLYRNLFKISPVEDVIRMRIERAKWLLPGSNMPMARVGEACGFASPYYFCRLFKARTGCSPGAYARLNR
jgi:AraC-like DNA-binding protein